MADLLVRLYDLPESQPLAARVRDAGYAVRRAQAFERGQVIAWIEEQFDARWASEAAVCFARQPISCHIAVREGRVVGFACHEATRRGFFGPTGVAPACRGKGVGALLLFEALGAMAALGYAYAIIGGVGPTAFYQRWVEAIEIPGSTPGIYRDALPRP